MNFEAAKQSPEIIADSIAGKIIERLGTTTIPFCFRTANGSVYASDMQGRTVRYRAASKELENPSLITAYLDHKYMDPAQISRFSGEYIPNSLVHENGFLAYDDGNDSAILKTLDDLPNSAKGSKLKNGLFLIVGDKIAKKITKKTPVTLIATKGFHPVEFCEPATNPHGHRNHIGNVIENLSMTDGKSIDETRRALKDLLLVSIGRKF